MVMADQGRLSSVTRAVEPHRAGPLALDCERAAAGIENNSAADFVAIEPVPWHQDRLCRLW